MDKELVKDKERIRKLLVCIGDRGQDTYGMELRRMNEILGRYITAHPDNSSLRNQIEKDLVSR